MISLNYQTHEYESAKPVTYDPSKNPASTPSYPNFNHHRADQKSPSTIMYCPYNSTLLASPTPTGLSLRAKDSFNEATNKSRYCSNAPDSPPPTPTVVKSDLARPGNNTPQAFSHFFTPNTTPAKAQSQWERPSLYHPQIVQYYHYPKPFNEPFNTPVTIANVYMN